MPCWLSPTRLHVQVKSVIAVIFMIIIQFLALVWYTLSYIPYARDCVKSACMKCFSK